MMTSPATDTPEAKTKVSKPKVARSKAKGKRGGPATDSQEFSKLLERFYPLVGRVVQSLMLKLPPTVEREELESVGLTGLVAAVGNYRPENEKTFKSYVRTRIRGAIMDELRRQDRLPRTARQKERQHRDLIEKLEIELGREPTEEEVREKLGLSSKAYGRFKRSIQDVSLLSLDAPQQDEAGKPVTFHERIADEDWVQAVDRLQHEERVGSLADAICALPDRYRKILVLYYYEGMRLSEIAALFEVSEARICQIHTRALALMKQSMAA